MKKHLKNVAVFVVLAVLLLPLALSILPQHAAADTSRINPTDLKNATYSWVDRTTIDMQIGSDTIAFKNSDITAVGLGDSKVHYAATGYGCTGDIFVLVGKGWTDLTGSIKYNSTTNGSTGCNDTFPISTNQAQNSANSALVYAKQDSNTIVRLDGNTQWTFTLSNTPNVYIKKSETGQCQDRIIVNSSGQMSLYVLNPTPHGIGGVLNGGRTGNGNTYRGLSNTEVHQLGLSGGESCVALNHDSASAEQAHGGAFLYAGTYSALGTAANVAAAGAANTTAGGANAGVASNEDPNLHCNVTVLNPLSWFLCPMIHAVMAAIGSLDNIINFYLNLNADQIFGGNGDTGYKAAWTSMRDLSLGILVIMALVMVVSQAAGLEIFDAYTVRKVLPRLLIATIAIALSWTLLELAVNFTNDLGHAMRSIIYSPFATAGTATVASASGTGSNTINLGGGGDTIITILGGLGFASLGFFGLLSFAATALMGLAVAVFVLIVRQIVLTILIIAAPFAIVCYILPNTQKVYKLWFDFLGKGLMMFPIIAAFIAAGRVFAVVSSANGGNAGVNNILSLIGYIAPYFLLPLTFRFAGGAIGAIGGFANDKSRGAFDRVKKFRQNEFQKNGQRRIDSGQRRVLQKRIAAQDSLKARATTTDSKFKRGALRFAAGRIGGHNLSATNSAQTAASAKMVNDMIATGPDGLVRGATADLSQVFIDKDTGKRQYRSLGGAMVDEADVMEGKRLFGKDSFAMQAAVSYEMRKANSEQEVDNIGKNYSKLTRSLGINDSRAAGMWQGAAFENQNQHLEFKGTNWDGGGMSEGGRKKFINEIYEKKGAYPLSQMSSNTIKELSDAYDIADREGDEETKMKLRAISETFVHDIGTGGGGLEPRGADGATIPVDSGPAPSAEEIAKARAEGRPIPRQVSAQGSAHVAERVNEFATKTGAIIGEAKGPYTSSDHIDPAKTGARDMHNQDQKTKP